MNEKNLDEIVIIIIMNFFMFQVQNDTWRSTNLSPEKPNISMWTRSMKLEPSWKRMVNRHENMKSTLNNRCSCFIIPSTTIFSRFIMGWTTADNQPSSDAFIYKIYPDLSPSGSCLSMRILVQCFFARRNIFQQHAIADAIRLPSGTGVFNQTPSRPRGWIERDLSDDLRKGEGT